MIPEILTPGRLVAEECSPGQFQILALLIDLLVDEEVFLLRTDLRRDAAGLLVPEETQDPDCLAADLIHGA